MVMFVSGVVAMVYLTWSAFFDSSYVWGPYVSPLYHVPYVPEWWPLSPAFLLLWIPAGFRLTCYYGRKVYYRAVFGDPAACGVEEPYRTKNPTNASYGVNSVASSSSYQGIRLRQKLLVSLYYIVCRIFGKRYNGESKLPFILNNLHRYFLYFALALVVMHWYEFLVHTLFHDGEFYFGVGSLLIMIDTLALTFYVGGCHSLRHLVGGRKRAVFGCNGCDKNCSKVRYGMWRTVSKFNIFHNVWFWISLFSIAVADLYVRLLALGYIPYDLHL